MNIILAGYNVDCDKLDRLNKGKNEILTPETFSAAYARISRSSDDVTALRKQANNDVLKARKSNKTIIFSMGHHSVAEHAVFNFDIMEVSRLAMEAIEKLRLVSYTEKSQRYVTLKEDYIIPEELKDNRYLEDFKDTIRMQNNFYKKSFNRLKEYIFDTHKELAKAKKNKNLLEGWAKEDARYILSLATQGQLGMTINARNLEHLFRRLSLSPLKEIRDIGKKMYNLVENIAPSIILFPQPSEFDKNVDKAIKSHLGMPKPSSHLPADVEILSAAENADDNILATLLSIQETTDFNVAFRLIKKMDSDKKKRIYMDLFRPMEFFDSPPREFEIPSITFQALVSASNFAQLKRHRMATLLSGQYDPRLGNTVPVNMQKTGLDKEFHQIIDHTNQTYGKLEREIGTGADYILTNSHRRLTIMKMNLREAYHFIRLRDDEHAQWDIRDLAGKITKEIKARMPLASLMLCGKSDYIDQYRKIFNTNPKFLI